MTIKHKIVMNVQQHDPNGGGGANSYGIEQIREQLLNAVRGIRFGSVEITVHDGKVVQIERKEKIRFANSVLRQDA
jgi:hypothetical protein